VNRYAPVASYIDLIACEIDLLADALGEKHPVSHLHWGGGSPTMLRPDDIVALAATLRDRFPVLGATEFAVEIDPRGFRAETAEALAAAGVTRVSLGIQDFDARVQRAINRVQTLDETAGTVESLRRRGINELNVDLIYGLPHQTVEGLSRTVREVVSMSPDRLAVFGYAHVPHFKRHQELIPSASLPDPMERFRQAEAVHSLLCEYGYVPIGLDHFAKPDDSMVAAQLAGRLRRNFQGYTTDTAPALIGIGASSISSLPQGYAQNASDVPSWRAAIKTGRLATLRGIALTDDDRLRRHVIERLMCDLRVDLAAAAASFGRDVAVFRRSLARLKPLIEIGVASRRDYDISIVPRWRAMARLVCAAFDSYLHEDAARHAAAV
jgi:oxygen-independent coproporphyrinogen III oxidase